MCITNKKKLCNNKHKSSLQRWTHAAMQKTGSICKLFWRKVQRSRGRSPSLWRKELNQPVSPSVGSDVFQNPAEGPVCPWQRTLLRPQSAQKTLLRALRLPGSRTCSKDMLHSPAVRKPDKGPWGAVVLDLRWGFGVVLFGGGGVVGGLGIMLETLHQ